MDRKILPQFNQLTRSVHKLLLNHLAKQVRAAFIQADSTLFECAEKAENNQVQTMFFESIRDVRQQRLAIERRFLEHISAQFNSFVNGTAVTTHNAHEMHADSLALVQTDDFEESLLVSSMCKKTSDRCTEALYGIEQRLALINGGKKPGASSPLTPSVIANSFCTALASSAFTLQIKTILYMLFEQFVMRELDAFYASANQLFIDTGVLPNLKYSTAQSKMSSPVAIKPHAAQARQKSSTEFTSYTNSTTQSNSAKALQPSSAAEHSTIEDPSNHLQAATIHTLMTLLRQQKAEVLPDGVFSIAALVAQDATEQYSVTQLLTSLAHLQQQAAEYAKQQPLTLQSVAHIKTHLIEQLQGLRDNSADHKIPEQYANTIDLVGMLFSFIIEDENLSETSKTILSNLHSLYLQVALQDASLFTNHQHPARTLLNRMAQAGILYCGISEEHTLQQKMQFTVSQALQSFSGDSALFDYLLQDFNLFLDTLKQRIELREKRAIEAAKGRDKLLAARNQARALINSVIKNTMPVSLICNFLQHTWVDVLIFAFLRHGPASVQWQRYAEVAQQLAWSGTLLDAKQQQRLEELRTALLEDLRKGLELLGSHHPDMILSLLHDLTACQNAVQAQQTLPIQQNGPKIVESPLGTMLGEETLCQPTDSLSVIAQDFTKQLERIDFGTWFKFDSPAATLKLSWFSTTTRNYMFVDASGQRVAIKTLAALAAELEQGTARIITNNQATPLMDRALSAVQKVLQHFSHKPV